MKTINIEQYMKLMNTFTLQLKAADANNSSYLVMDLSGNHNANAEFLDALKKLNFKTFSIYKKVLVIIKYNRVTNRYPFATGVTESIDQ